MTGDSGREAGRLPEVHGGGRGPAAPGARASTCGCPTWARRWTPAWPRSSLEEIDRGHASTSTAPTRSTDIWLGAADDVIMRERGVEFVDGTAPGFCALVGARPDPEIADKIAQELQEKNLYVFMAATINGTTVAEQLLKQDVQLGWETRLVPFGTEMASAVYSLGFAARAAHVASAARSPATSARSCATTRTASSPSCWPSDEVDDEKYANAAGAINYGFPTIADTDIPEILPTGVCTYEHVVSNVPHDEIVQKARRGPGAQDPGHQGPHPDGVRPRLRGRAHPQGGHVRAVRRQQHPGLRVRRDDGDGRDRGRQDRGHRARRSTTWRRAAPCRSASWSRWPGARCRRTSSRSSSARSTTSSTAPRASGTWASATSSGPASARRPRPRASSSAHYGEITPRQAPRRVPRHRGQGAGDHLHQREGRARSGSRRRARRTRYRDERTAGMTDESVDTFYSCTLCQSFAPNHVCVITPERLGPVRRLQLARRQGGLRDRPDRPQPADPEGRLPRRRQGPVEERQRVRLEQLRAEASRRSTRTP